MKRFEPIPLGGIDKRVRKVAELFLSNIQLLAIVKYLVELVGFSRADFSLFPFEASAALLRNNLRGSQNLLTVRSKTSGEPFPVGKTRFGKAPHKKSGAVGVCLLPQLLVLFTGTSQSHSFPVGCSVDAHREEE